MFEFKKVTIMGPMASPASGQTAFLVKWDGRRQIGMIFETDNGYNIDQWHTPEGPTIYYDSLDDAANALFWSYL